VTIETALGLLALEVLLVALFGIRRYGTPLNPLTFLALYETALTTLLSGVVAYTLLPLAPYSAGDMVKTVALSGLYLLSRERQKVGPRGVGPASDIATQ